MVAKSKVGWIRWVRRDAASTCSGTRPRAEVYRGVDLERFAMPVDMMTAYRSTQSYGPMEGP